jgi:polyhydroxyalkanoate synthesis regulator phasin
MRRKLVIATTAGVLTLSGLAVAVPALADDPATSGGAAAAEERIRDALSDLVDDGTLTEEQAAEVASTLAESGVGGRGGHRGGVALETAAEALGLTEEELRDALATEGTTLADVAEEQGVDLDTLVGALVQATEERIAEAVEDGRLTQEEADERLADLEEEITERVQSDMPARGGEGRGPGRGHSAD